MTVLLCLLLLVVIGGVRADFGYLMKQHGLATHNPEHSCSRRITDWPALKRVLNEYAEGQLQLAHRTGVESCTQHYAEAMREDCAG